MLLVGPRSGFHARRPSTAGGNAPADPVPGPEPRYVFTALWWAEQPHGPRSLAGGGRKHPGAKFNPLFLLWWCGAWVKTHLMQRSATTAFEIDPDARGVLSSHPSVQPTT